LYVEDLKRGTNKEVGPKDIFEMASSKIAIIFCQSRSMQCVI